MPTSVYRYLGAGELYGVAALLAVLGNNFANSIFAAEFLTWFCFELLALAACRAEFASGRAAGPPPLPSAPSALRWRRG